jgi:glycosyltransferase 2 family protein
MRGWVRVVGTLVVLSGAVAFILSRVDVGKTLHILGSASPGWLLLSAVLTMATVPGMAWRWGRLLSARGIDERLPWLIRAYFVSYAVGQVLPTAVGGDASRIFETARRHRGRITPITGSVLVERALGGAVTLCLAGAGFLLAIGRYSIGAYLWIELVSIVVTVGAGVVFFSRSIRRRLGFAVPYGSRRRRGPSTTGSTATGTTSARSSPSRG